MKLKGTQEGFDAWIKMCEVLGNLIEVHPDSLGSQREVRFWVDYLTADQVLQVIEAGGWTPLLEEAKDADPLDVMTDMLDTMRLEAGLSGYYLEADWG